jgi:antitoxin component YwqK of YwqJK toxin-antitoxin module
MKRIFINIILCFLLISCSENNIHQAVNISIPNFSVEDGDNALVIKNGALYYKGGLFSGYLTSHFKSSALKEKSPYLNGKLEGAAITWFENGQIESQRNYSGGEKDGTHYGWYPDGTARFEYNYKNGLSEGQSTDWYPNGKLFQEKIFTAGAEASVKAWRDTGKLYANYIVKDGVIFGLNNSTLCYSLKNERGEYVPSK